MKKRIISLLITFVLCFVPFNIVFASKSANVSYQEGGGGNSGTTSKPTFPDFKPGLPSADNPLNGTVNTILGIIKWVAYVVAIVMVMYVGVKYLTAGAGVKAEAKSTLVPMLIGAVLVALAPTLVQWIFGALG